MAVKSSFFLFCFVLPFSVVWLCAFNDALPYSQLENACSSHNRQPMETENSVHFQLQTTNIHLIIHENHTNNEE